DPVRSQARPGWVGPGRTGGLFVIMDQRDQAPARTEGEWRGRKRGVETIRGKAGKHELQCGWSSGDVVGSEGPGSLRYRARDRDGVSPAGGPRCAGGVCGGGVIMVSPGSWVLRFEKSGASLRISPSALFPGHSLCPVAPAREEPACLLWCPSQSELYWWRTDRIVPGDYDGLQGNRGYKTSGCRAPM
ncbi:Adenosylhomocysteinase, partial [Dissostichus eleginoides]